jgi:[ribosomal protein S18]-alanine N-acetyltransferase
MSAQPNLLLRFEAMMEADVATVLSIETRTYGYPWSAGNFRDSIHAGHSCWLCKYGGLTIGYGIVLIAAAECHLLNLTIAPEWQGKGYGKSLLLHLIAQGVIGFADRFLLEVRPSNAVGRKLYARLGFAVIGVRRNYYPAPAGREDAIVMERKL